jgi:hypothetical protein
VCEAISRWISFYQGATWLPAFFPWFWR